ncbi:MAG: NAD-glutamate dehydrogenase, partial [Mariprofundaceae bacterium]
GIIHTHASNHVINHVGLTSIHHLQSLVDAPLDHIVETLLLVDELTDAQALRQALWTQSNDPNTCNQLQHGIQEHLMHFAEELLRLCPANTLTFDWLTKQQKELRRFRKATQGLGYDSHDNYPKILKDAEGIGLEHIHAVHLAAMPELAQSASAIHLANDKKLPLSRCLKALQACLHLLPFVALETPLRSQYWGDAEAHELRREWLHRLTILKARAASQLLDKKSPSLLAAGKKRWGQHKHWNALQALMHPNKEKDVTKGDKRMQLMLSLTHLEAVIDES